ncbi:MAG: GC-type dockerin domain-anchored protein, partial [Phycisphaerales bacterium]
GAPASSSSAGAVAVFDVSACGEAPACPADINGNGTTDPGDFTAWVAAYNAGLPAADQNSNGSVEPGDFTAWIAAYNIGCP